APQSSAKLFLNEGYIVDLGENDVVTIGHLSVQRADGKRLPPHVTRFILSGSRESGRTLLSEAAVEGKRHPSDLPDGPAPGSMIWPLPHSVLLDDRPAFTWRPAFPSARYHVDLSSADR